jgi:hypothetical protein
MISAVFQGKLYIKMLPSQFTHGIPHIEGFLSLEVLEAFPSLTK